MHSTTSGSGKVLTFVKDIGITPLIVSDSINADLHRHVILFYLQTKANLYEL